MRYHRWLRFSLFGMLTAVAVAAGFFGGYRWGDRVAVCEHYRGSMLVKLYDVSDLVCDGRSDDVRVVSANLKRLTKLIVATIEYDSWTEHGTGPGEIQPYPPNRSFIVSHLGSVHDQIEALLANLRSQSGAATAAEIIPRLQELAATKDAWSQICLRWSGDVLQAKSATVTQWFDAAVDAVAARWGRPDFRGACDNALFPKWSVGQLIATWPRNGGVAFIEVRDFRASIPDDEPANLRGLFVGWRGEDAVPDAVVEYRLAESPDS